MISLQDEIKKFQRLAYNQQLAEFITVDKMFVGGGITMQSIIHESNFIVEELKKMNAVFKNYCKLNEKVYTKIMEHQLNVHNEQAKLNSLTNSVDRKLEEAVKQIAELHQDTLLQNQKNYTILNQKIEPIRKQLAQKVNQETFSTQMKKFLDEYDEGEEQQELGQEKIKNGPQSGITSEREPSSPYPKKKGKVGFDQFYRFREELDSKLKGSDDQNVVLFRQAGEAKDLILKYIPQINNLSFQLTESKSNIHTLSLTQSDQANQFNNSISKLNAELNARLNEQVWSHKFEQFNEKQVKPIVHKLEESLKTHKNSFGSYKEEIITKFKEVDGEMNKNKIGIAVAKKEIQKVVQENERLLGVMKQNYVKFEIQTQKLSKSIQIVSHQSKKQKEQLQKTTAKQLSQLKSKLSTIVLTVQQSVIKVVSKRFDGQLKIIEKDIRQNLQSIKLLNNDIELLELDIRNIKNMLAQKANFTDFVHHVEKKADKQDFKQLQSKILQTSQQMHSKQLKQLNESINLSRLQKTENPSTRRISSINRGSKTLAVPQTAHNRSDMDSGTKLFMCGMDNHSHMIDCRKQYSQNSRRKTLKSSTAMACDFIL